SDMLPRLERNLTSDEFCMNKTSPALRFVVLSVNQCICRLSMAR
uniref:Uncharacterized protein n=1 Tax=Aegilops tauschii subsp. strangulata TaxID=200361 RepID=A0A453EXA3_AEGTS